MSTRQNLIYVIVGEIGAGKTDTIKNIIRMIMSKNKTIKKLVVFDEFDSDVWKNMKTWDHQESESENLTVVSESELLRLKSGKVRLIQEDFDLKHYCDLFKKVSNSIIVLEDATRYIDPQEKVPKSLRSLITNVKQKNVELILVFHSLLDVHSFVARNCRVIILHHTLDGEVPKKLSNPLIKQAFNELHESPLRENPHASKFIPINVTMNS